jgi:tripartite-type tricarboxylate transporter receptor subunit TctC
MRHSIFGAAALALLLAFAPGAHAQKFPAKPVRLIIPTTPGGGLDIAARQVGHYLSQRLGQPVLIESIGGASQQLGTNAMVRSTPDGHTLLFTASTPITIAENFEPKPPYDARRDIAGVAIVARNPGLLVTGASVKAANMAEFVALAKSQPKRLFYGTPGQGHVFHLISELFFRQAGIELTHVPYKGSAPAIVALLAGDIQFLLQSPEAVREHMRAGKLRALATLEPNRLDTYPDVPTLAQAGQKNLNVWIWYGVLAPSKTPPDVIAVLERELQAVSKTPDFSRKLKEMDFEPVFEGSREFARRMADEFELWPGLVKSLGLSKARD